MSIAPITVDPMRQPAAAAAATPATAATADSDKDSGISFHDILDIVNPLQHLPVVGTLYRKLTGEQIKPFPKAAGDLLYGGPLGFVGSIADTLFEKLTGKDFGSTIFDGVKEAFTGGDDTKDVASNAPAASASTSTTSTGAPTLIAALDTKPIGTIAAPVASNAPVLPAPANVNAASLDSIVVPGQEALLSALSTHGIGLDVAQRAADAYRRAVNVAPANDTLPEPTLRASIAQ